MIQLLKRGSKRTILAYKSKYLKGEVHQTLYNIKYTASYAL
jgi:hypothetical protein